MVIPCSIISPSDSITLLAGKIGIIEGDDGDIELGKELLDVMHQGVADYALFFRRLSGFVVSPNITEKWMSEHCGHRIEGAHAGAAVPLSSTAPGEMQNCEFGEMLKLRSARGRFWKWAADYS